MFDKTVKESAMVACGRRCCLCHLYCGGKMECHHIVEQANGGDNSFENCIPLCFDCHSEAGHYNDKHPKGTKFSPGELRKHRDKWFATVESGISPKGSKELEALDIRFFRRIVSVLGGSRGMFHFREHDYGNSYSFKIEERLYGFLDTCDLPETEFQERRMEEVLADLRAAVKDYRTKFVNRVWCDSGNVANIPPEWAHGNERAQERFEEARKTMNQAATEIWERYAEFIKSGRKILGIDPEEEDDHGEKPTR